MPSRKKIKEVEGIDLNYVCNVIPSGNYELVSLDGKFAKYKPFDEVFIDNFADTTLRAYINQAKDNFIDIPSNAGKKKTNQEVINVKVENTGINDTASGDVVLTLTKNPARSDDVAKTMIGFFKR